MKPTLEQVEYLEQLSKPDSKPLLPDRGLCGNFRTYFRRKYPDRDALYLEWLEGFSELVQKWPLFSGDLVYPMPGGRAEYEREYRTAYPQFWVGERGRLRRELCAYLAAGFRKQLESSSPRRSETAV